jgi:sec-independent protein translocase protein TatA
MPDLGVPELLIIAVIVLLLFGPGKAADIGGSLGKSIREFRKATREDDESPATLPPPSSSASEARFCGECGVMVTTEQKFCPNCGTASTAYAQATRDVASVDNK